MFGAAAVHWAGTASQGLPNTKETKLTIGKLFASCPEMWTHAAGA